MFLLIFWLVDTATYLQSIVDLTGERIIQKTLCLKSYSGKIFQSTYKTVLHILVSFLVYVL